METKTRITALELLAEFENLDDDPDYRGGLHVVLDSRRVPGPTFRDPFHREQLIRVFGNRFSQSQLELIAEVCAKHDLRYTVGEMRIKDARGQWHMPMLQIEFRFA